MEEAARLLNNRRRIIYDFRETGPHFLDCYGSETGIFMFRMDIFQFKAIGDWLDGGFMEEAACLFSKQR